MSEELIELKKQLQDQEARTRDNLDNCIIKVSPILLGLLFSFLPFIIEKFAANNLIKWATLFLTFFLVGSIIANVLSQIFSIKESKAIRKGKTPKNRTARFNRMYQSAFIASLIMIPILTAIVLFIQPEPVNAEQKISPSLEGELRIR